jgi:thermitase
VQEIGAFQQKSAVGTALFCFGEYGILVPSMHYFSISRRIAVALSILMIPSLVLARTPNDPGFSQQWYLETIGAPQAWDSTTGSSSVLVAVLDTGIDLDHEDVVSNLWMNAGEIANNDIDDDRNGYVDDVHGWDFVDGDNDPSPEVDEEEDFDVASHGTLIAGEIGAVGNNDFGVAGVAWNVSILPVRMLGEDGSGTGHDAASAIRYAVEQGAKVINLSFAGNDPNTALQNAVRDAYAQGVVVVAALGNDGRDTDRDPVYPACLRVSDEDWVIGVTAVTEQNLGAEFTNYGVVCADIAAPGTSIIGLSYQQDGIDGFDRAYSGLWSGTSMASPLVAGAAALLFSEYPTLSAGDVRNILKLSVDPVRGTGYPSGGLGAGRLNVARALELAATYAPEPESPNQDDATDDVPVVSEENDEEAQKPSVETPEDILQYSFVAFGAPAGVLPEVDVYRANGTQYARFQAYTSNFSGGVRVATINNEGSNVPRIVTAAGETGGPHIRVFTAFGAVAHEFFAYSKDSSHGVNISIGDMNGDGVDDIVTSVGSGVSQDIVTWSEAGVELSRFTASLFPASSPLSVATVDYDDDIAEEIAVTGVIDGVARVALYDGDGTYLVDFTPYDGARDISVSRVDLDGDYYDDIAVSSLAGTNDIRVFTKIGALRGSKTLTSQALIGNRIIGADLDLDGSQDLVVLENTDAGLVTLLSSDLRTVIGSFSAPSFSTSAGAYLAAW